jgi:hypothetical protein
MAADLQALKQTVFGDQSTDADTVKQKEEAISKLADAYVKQQDAKALTELLSQLRPFFAVIPKAKTAKIVRSIIDQISKIPNSTDIQVSFKALAWHAGASIHTGQKGQPRGNSKQFAHWAGTASSSPSSSLAGICSTQTAAPWWHIQPNNHACLVYAGHGVQGAGGVGYC